MKKLLFIYFLFVSFFNCAQLDYGFMGKKNLFEVNLDGGPRLFGLTSNTYSHTIYDSNGIGVKKRSPFKMNVNLGYRRLLSQKFSFGFELSYNWFRSNFYSPSIVYNGYNSAAQEILQDYHRIAVTPEFIMNGRNSLGFKGFSMVIGAGPTFYFLGPKKDFYSKDGELTNYTYEVANPVIMGLRLVFGVDKRVSIGNNLFIDFGLRVANEFAIGKRFESSVFLAEYDVVITNDDIISSINSRINPDIFSFKLGVAYQF